MAFNFISRKIGIVLVFVVVILIAVAGFAWFKTLGRVQLQFDIHQNKEIIYLSTFAEPPQFAIWLEDPDDKKLKTVFVTHRVSIGDWEGKPDVPVALPRWIQLFKNNNSKENKSASVNHTLTVTGATPKDDYFTVRVDVPPGSKWICWIEMNLSGDFNEAFPELNEETFREDEFSCGQPALLFKAEIIANEGNLANPEIVAQSVWENGKSRIEPVSAGVNTAKNVFDQILISVLKPKGVFNNSFNVKLFLN